MRLRTIVGIVLVALWLTACASQSTATVGPGGTETPAEVSAQEPSPVPEQPTELAEPPAPPAEASPTSVSEDPTAPPPPQPEVPASAASVTSLPADLADYAWELLADSLSYPLGFADPGDGSGRLFILGQTGPIYILRDGQVQSELFLDLSGKVSGPRPGSYSEQGLLGMAFHPQYTENGYFFVYYTDLNGDTVVSRFHVSDNPDQADQGSEEQFLKVDQPYQNHNGGALAFGPDGYLYIGLGDGGSAGDPEGRAQSLDTYLGKVLRISVDNGQEYDIPADNPFASGGGLPEIWAYGLRNPWRFAFDSMTGDFYIADVGQNQYEEVNFVPAGSPGGINFGWDFREGLHLYEGEPPAAAEFQDPVAEYSHAEGCSITGGVVVRDPSLPDLQGVYLYGDYCSGRVWGLWRDAGGAWQSQVIFETSAQISSFGESVDGQVFMSDLAGSVYFLSK